MNLTAQDHRAHERNRNIAALLTFTDDVSANLTLLAATVPVAFANVETAAEAAVLNFAITQKNGYLARAWRCSERADHIAAAHRILEDADRLSATWPRGAR